MVDALLVTKCSEVLGERRLRILVTGATGFVGRALTETLVAAGQDVTAMGRNEEMRPAGARFVQAQIEDADRIQELCKEQDAVVHCAANASPWLPLESLLPANVEGTRNIVAACLENNVSRLVHVSSTAFQFTGRDSYDLSEEDMPMKHSHSYRFACGYAESKFLAEKVVLDQCAKANLSAMIVRARAIFGPGDRHLLPRVLKAYDCGQLRQIGDGKNETDLTYIDNLVYALVLAICSNESGATCTVTGNEPVQLWPLLRRVCDATGRKRPFKKVPYSLAYFAAYLGEIRHRLLKLSGEPTLTRYSVGLLARSQTFSIEAARKHLGYKPIVDMEEGIQRTIRSLVKHDGG